MEKTDTIKNNMNGNMIPDGHDYVFQEACNIEEIIPLPIMNLNIVSKFTDFDMSKYKVCANLKITHIVTKNGTLQVKRNSIPLSNMIHDETLTGLFSFEDNTLTLSSLDKSVTGVILQGTIIRYTLPYLNHPIDVSNMIDPELTKINFDHIAKPSDEQYMLNKIYDTLKDKSSSELSRILKNIKGINTKATPREFKGKEISEEIGAMLQRKNSDYGSAVYKDYKEYGITAILVWLNHKNNRLNNLVKKGKADVEDESFVDTLKDLAGYAICGLDALGYHHNEEVK